MASPALEDNFQKLYQNALAAAGSKHKPSENRRKEVDLALGRIFRMGSRPNRPGDVAEYERCRMIILNATDPVTADWTPNYTRDRNKGAAGD